MSHINSTTSDAPVNLRIRPSDFYYNPPNTAVEAGVVKRKSFPLSERDAAFAYAEENNKLIDEWRSTTRYLRSISKDSRIKHLLLSYFNSVDYGMLKEVTRKQYKVYAALWENTKVSGIVFENMKISALSTPLCQRMYDAEIKRSNVHNANYAAGIYRLIFNYAIRNGYTEFNPFEKIKRKSVKARKVMWDRAEVRAFLNTSFSQYKWRNVGLIVYMIYEWGQRVSDILNIRWENIDLDNETVTIHQSKRGAVVKLPISKGLLNMLKQQKRDFPLSNLVCPQQTRRNGKWVPYTIQRVNDFVKEIMEAAKLDRTLQLRDLRRTAITETIENGGDLLTVMQMSGHQSASSVTPYFVHTLRGATKAQEIRQFPQQLLERA